MSTAVTGEFAGDHLCLAGPPLPPIGRDLVRAVIVAGIEAAVRHLVLHEPETPYDLAEPSSGASTRSFSHSKCTVKSTEREQNTLFG